MALNVYDTRRRVYVTPFAGSTVRYGFATNCLQSVSADCGHTPVDPGNIPTGLVFGANAPKPGRASKKEITGTNGSFYDAGNAATLRAAGYTLSLPFIRRAGASENSRTVYVTINGFNYAWRMPSTTYTRIGGDRAALGIQDATQNDRNLVFGARTPKPPKVSAAIGSDIISTFGDPSIVDNLPDGWAISGREYINT